MAVLTLCDHSILSIGTFGWWSAWLTGGKVVYYSPNSVCGNTTTHTQDKRVRGYHLEDWVPL